MEYGPNPIRVLISYHRADFQWAKWIAWLLAESQYSPEMQEAQSQPDLLLKLEAAFRVAQHIILVLSPDYLSLFEQRAEWSTILKQDSIWQNRHILPLQVRDCRSQLRENEAFVVSIDQFKDEEIAGDLILMNLQWAGERNITASASSDAVYHPISKRPRFPGDTLISSHVPRRNLFFTDRVDTLLRLHSELTTDTSEPLPRARVLSGLGGIGKTQIAVEYAFRYSDEYKAILWARAASREMLSQDFLSIAEQLDLIEENESYKYNSVASVKKWLQEHTDWLLILDDVVDIEAISDFISVGQGHVLITTRMQLLGQLTNTLEIEKLKPEDSTLLLLRRTGTIGPKASLDNVPSTDYENALGIAHIMDGLPLALDQAAAYIEETACGLSGYLERYRTQRVALLKRRGGFLPEQPESVATTWSLSFEKVQNINPDASNLLRICSFLHSDAIPEEILFEGIRILNPALDTTLTRAHLNVAIEELCKFSLLRHNPDPRLLSIHPIVQLVLKDALDEQTQRLWAERTIWAVIQAFPSVEFTQWTLCQHCLPHVQVCAMLIKQWNLLYPQAAHLLHEAAFYLWQRAEYEPAERLYIQALEMQERLFGREHPAIARTFHNMALLYKDQGKYDETEHFFKRALDIRQKLEPDTAAVGTSLTGLGWTYRTQGKNTLAKTLLEEALVIRERTLGPQHPDVAQTLNKLAWVYYDLGRYREAEPLHLRALAIRERALGPNHPSVAQNLSNLGWLYDSQAKYAQAEKLYLRALDIRRQALHPDHPDTAQTLSNLALLYYHEGRYPEAKTNYKNALRIRQQVLGEKHTYTAQTQGNLALLYQAQGKYSLAESYYKRALKIRENALGRNHPDTAGVISNLAELYVAQGRYEQAEPLFQEALTIREETLGKEHPHVAQTLNSLGELYVAQGRYEQAESLFQEALTIREETLGKEHPHVAQTLNSLAKLFMTRQRYKQAENLYSKAIIINEQKLESNHPFLITVLANYAELLHKTNREEEASRIEAYIQKIRVNNEQELSFE